MRQGRVVPAHEWMEMSTPDVYFTNGYHTASELVEPDSSESVLLEWTDDAGCVRLPLILRKIPGQGYFDAISAYGYGGPWIEGQPDLALFRKFFDEWASDKHIVSSFLRFHPLLENAENFSKIFSVKRMSQTAAWDLESPGELVEGMAKNHRQSWRRAVRTGVEARLTQNPTDVEGFRSLYELAMERLSAKSFYWFSDEYWASLRDQLGKQSLLVEAVYQDRVVAAAWCLISDDYLHFHLSGTTDEGRQIGGAFISWVAAAQWARDAGLSEAHLGGGVGGSDSSLLEWKRRFDVSSPLRDFYVAEVVHDEDAFVKFSDGFSEDGFFPPWRDPLGKKINQR